MDLRISVVITRHVAVGLMVISPVMRPTSPNSSWRSLNFWFESAFSIREEERQRCEGKLHRQIWTTETTKIRFKIIVIYDRPHLNGGRVNDSLTSLEGFRDGPLGNDRFPRRRMCSYENRLFLINVSDGLRLERVQLKWIDFGRIFGWDNFFFLRLCNSGGRFLG